MGNDQNQGHIEDERPMALCTSDARQSLARPAGEVAHRPCGPLCLSSNARNRRRRAQTPGSSRGDDNRIECAADSVRGTQKGHGGITDILGHLFPVRWKSFEVAKDAPIEWTASSDRAVARLDGGKAGEVVLKRFEGMTVEPVVIKNLRYFGAPRNDGFIMIPNEVEAYRLGPKAYEFKGTNGFMLTLDIDADTAPAKAKATGM
jgi:hypothetical protein